jgi:hypothetical protein
MRLLDTTTSKLHEFYGEGIPSYAILLHRWEEEEISYQDLKDGEGQKLAGFAKIKVCCARASLKGFEYVWIDACCIDKTSSAELSKAINSMFLCYQNAQVCYVHLSDAAKEGQLGQKFSESKWFTRGWALQELLALSFVVFYDSFWNELGIKLGLEAEIASITGISSLSNIDQACEAEKTS